MKVIHKKGSVVLIALLAFGAVLLATSFAFVDVKVERLTRLSAFDDFKDSDMASVKQRIAELENSFDKVLDAPVSSGHDGSSDFVKDIDRINLALNALHEQLEAYQGRQDVQQDLLDQ